jgi:hypothetical protein
VARFSPIRLKPAFDAYPIKGCFVYRRLLKNKRMLNRQERKGRRGKEKKLFLLSDEGAIFSPT